MFKLNIEMEPHHNIYLFKLVGLAQSMAVVLTGSYADNLNFCSFLIFTAEKNVLQPHEIALKHKNRDVDLNNW